MSLMPLDAVLSFSLRGHEAYAYLGWLEKLVQPGGMPGNPVIATSDLDFALYAIVAYTEHAFGAMCANGSGEPPFHFVYVLL